MATWFITGCSLALDVTDDAQRRYYRDIDAWQHTGPGTTFPKGS